MPRVRRRRSRSRSRSPVRRTSDRNRRRSRSRDRNKRKRSRSRERNKDRYDYKTKGRSPSPKRGRSPKHQEGAIIVKDGPLDPKEEAKRLEEEMKKRRERIEKWRQEKKVGKSEKAPLVVLPPSKNWSLENDEDSDEETEAKKEATEEADLDPLDAFMQSVQDEVQQTKLNDLQGDSSQVESESKGKVTVITGIAKKPANPEKAKGELMEENADLMEYSSEEETDDLGDIMKLAKGKKKQLAAVDHEKVYYRPVRKEFYVEVPEIARMAQEEVDAYRLELDDVKVRGKKCPRPIKTWAQCGVSKKVLDALKRNNFEKPTPIQSQAVPAIMSGRDLIGIAKTGSGKTLAFLLPMFRHILDQPPLEESDGPIAVIMTPTRELALQIGSDCRKFTKSLSLHVVVVYGGTGISEQIAELKRGAEIIVCTPGRMIDMLAANSGRVTNLRRCSYIVLDEADRMFDMGFEPQVMKIVENIRPDRQTVMFSATFPRAMEALARKILTKPVEIQVGGRSVVCSDVAQYVIVLEEENKFYKLLELLGLYIEEGSILVFVDKQENADELVKMLIKHGYTCMPLHGGIDQYDRDSTINDFKQGSFKVLIATGVAARGLDVKELVLVVNYSCPNHQEEYVHRCGRTGRAGNKGYAYTFVTPDQYRYAGAIIKALEQSEISIPPELQEMWDTYVSQAQAEGRKVSVSSGFVGRGFKFDESEAQMAKEKKKLQKAVLGLDDEDDEEGAADLDQKIEDMFASRRRVTDVAQPIINQPQPIQQSGQNQQKLELAKKLAAGINFRRNLGEQAQDITQQAAAAYWKGQNIATPLLSTKSIAEQMAEKINAKLGYKPPQEEEEEKEEEKEKESFKRYEEELEINDFPQTARWRITSKETMSQISEYAEAGITVRGTYFPPTRQPKSSDDRKLYLAIEATSELAIQKAKAEVTRIIKEELMRAQNSSHQGNKGRYKVL